MEPKETYIPLSQWTSPERTYPTLHGMRRRYKFRKEMGYETCFFKEGKRIMVRLNEFLRCFENRGDKGVK